MQIPEMYRIPLVVVYMDGYLARGLAEMLDVPLGTVLARLHRNVPTAGSFLIASILASSWSTSIPLRTVTVSVMSSLLTYRLDTARDGSKALRYCKRLTLLVTLAWQVTAVGSDRTAEPGGFHRATHSPRHDRQASGRHGASYQDRVFAECAIPA
jgi:hypothetical protein